MLWSEVDLKLIRKEYSKNGRQKITYEGRPFRFQIPEGICIGGLSEYNSINIQIDDGPFLEWYEKLEEYIGAPEPFSSNLSENFRFKIDEFTQIFNHEHKLCSAPGLNGRRIKCIIEVSGVYFFKDVYGLTCRIYQLLYLPSECLFTHDLPFSSRNNDEQQCV
jgi:hypothetical protein